MVNAGEFVGGAVLGSGLGPFGDIGRETIGKFLEFEPCLTNLEYTQKSLQPSIDKIEEHNNTLGYPNEIGDLKAKMVEGDALHSKLKDASAWNLMTPFRVDQLVELEESREKQLGILQVQGVRDVKEGLVLARDHSKQLGDCKTRVDEIGDWTGTTTHQLHQVASDGKEAVSLGRELKTAFDQEFELRRVVKEDKALEALVEQAALGKSVEALDGAIQQGRWEENIIIKERWTWVRILFERIKNRRNTAALDSAVWGIPPEELKGFRIEIDKGVELARKCSQVTEWTTTKTNKYINKILGLEKTLEALVARLEQSSTLLSTKEGLKSTQSNYTTTNIGLAAPGKRIIT